jgi:hypothetical protein
MNRKQVLRFKEIDGKEANDDEAYKRICYAATETKALNELVKAGQALIKNK